MPDSSHIGGFRRLRAHPERSSPADAPIAIERYFDISLFLLLVTGFITLASTGRLDLGSIVFVSAALLLRAYMLLRNLTWKIPDRWTTYLTLAYVAVYVADLFLLSANFVAATVHLVLFSMVVKVFSVHRERDNVYLAILAFLAVLAASVLTVDTTFLVSFCIFLLLAVSTFISMEMKRSLKKSTAQAQSTWPRPGRRLPLLLSTATIILVFAITAVALLLFFILPRFSAGYLSAYSPKNEFVSGFSDHVRLGEIGQIKQLDTVVMHIQQLEGNAQPQDLRWRGVALSRFENNVWSNEVPEYEEIATTGRFLLRDVQIRKGNLPEDSYTLRGSRLLRYRVVMEPIGTTVIFAASVPVEIMGNFQKIGVDGAGSLTNIDHNRMTESYLALSQIPLPSAEMLRNSGDHYPSRFPIQLPSIDPRIAPLAERITAQASTPYAKALALERYLKTNFTYTLQLPSQRVADPLAYFLFERKAGHCEYFASSMAVMLRTLGIPSRIVNGFHMGEYNDLTGNYIVRARDAHSWVEAYIPNVGWMSFDPTPPDPRVVPNRWNRMLLYLDALQEFWREWVINYDFGHQRQLGTRAVTESQRVTRAARLSLARYYDAFLRWARDTYFRIASSPRRWIALAVGCLCMLLLTVNVTRIWRAMVHSRAARHPQNSPQLAASIWYQRMTKSLARQGYSKTPAQTPAEFVSQIPESQLRESVAQFTRHYSRARFGQSADDARRLPELYEEIRSR
ncbi:MAG TPA: DUF3488 and transglutaminase-like domain-containing protein [Terriglobales bacterium]|nr:DUF3488 and transglutaminase-like domain-containing protein [Terriglobales bacterium]